MGVVERDRSAPVVWIAARPGSLPLAAAVEGRAGTVSAASPSPAHPIPSGSGGRGEAGLACSGGPASQLVVGPSQLGWPVVHPFSRVHWCAG